MAEAGSLSPEEQERLLSALEAEIWAPFSLNAPGEDQLLFHYTDAEAFRGIIQSGELWATHSCYLNDFSEIRHGERLLEEEAKALVAKSPEKMVSAVLEDFLTGFGAFKASKKMDVYIASLSQERDQLSQWRAYGGSGSGYALGFSHYSPTAPPVDDGKFATILCRCEYDPDQFRTRFAQMVKGAVTSMEKCAMADTRDDWQLQVFATTLASLYRVSAVECTRLKHHSFHEEREWRIVALPHPSVRKGFPEFRPRNGSLVPFCKVPLNENRGHGLLTLTQIVVGPSEDPSRAELAAQMIVSKYADNPPVVTRSQIPFRGR